MKKICFLLAAGCLAACQSTDKGKQANVQRVASLPAYVQPPIPKADVPYQTYEFEAEKGARLTYRTGTTIEIPARALTDEAGKPIVGKVSLAYREFHDALDVLVSGIPMQYDSAGVRKTLQTAGMFDIRASQAGKNLRLAKGKQAQIRMASWQSEPDYNFYTLDTTKRNWAYQSRERVEVNTEKIQQKYTLEQLKSQANKTRFVVNLGNAFDISVDNADDKMYNNALKQAFMARFAGYKVQYLEETHAYNPVQVLGLGEHPAHDVLWETNMPLPALPKVKDGLYRAVTTAIGGGLYRFDFYLNWIEKEKKPVAQLVAKPVMRIASLLAHSPQKWQAEEEALMEKIRQEEERIKQIADVFRPVAINNFGIHNFDRYLKDDLVNQTVFVEASFKLNDAKTLSEKEIERVYYINPSIRSSTEYARGSWHNLGIVPDDKVRVLVLLKGNRLAVVRPQDYAKIDFARLKAGGLQKGKGLPTHLFELQEQTDLVRSQEDLRKALM